MTSIVILLVAAAVFGICYLVDKTFTKKFRSKTEHLSGMAVRANKMYGIFGVVLIVIGILAVIVGLADSLLAASLFWVWVQALRSIIWALAFSMTEKPSLFPAPARRASLTAMTKSKSRNCI